MYFAGISQLFLFKVVRVAVATPRGVLFPFASPLSHLPIFMVFVSCFKVANEITSPILQSIFVVQPTILIFSLHVANRLRKRSCLLKDGGQVTYELCLGINLRFMHSVSGYRFAFYALRMN